MLIECWFYLGGELKLIKMKYEAQSRLGIFFCIKLEKNATFL